MRHAMLIALVAGLLAGPGPVAAEVDPDVTDPALCTDGGEGWITVTMSFLVALGRARDAGTVGEQAYSELSIWFVRLQNRLAEGLSTAEFCRAILTKRGALRF
jgi:hypothetical protein